jgi:adenylate kinase
MKTIIVVGVPGCGKSSILKEATRQVPQIQVVNYGDKMLETAALEGISRDTLRKLPIPEQKKIGIHAAKWIVEQTGEGVILIDTHALVRTPNGYVPGLPKEVLETLLPVACVWIECLPALIVQRRAQDISRKRDEETIEELTLHQELSRAYLAACCLDTGAVLCCLNNSGASVEQNAAPLIRLIQSQ